MFRSRDNLAGSGLKVRNPAPAWILKKILNAILFVKSLLKIVESLLCMGDGAGEGEKNGVGQKRTGSATLIITLSYQSRNLLSAERIKLVNFVFLQL